MGLGRSEPWGSMTGTRAWELVRTGSKGCRVRNSHSCQHRHSSHWEVLVAGVERWGMPSQKSGQPEAEALPAWQRPELPVEGNRCQHTSRTTIAAESR